MEQHRWSVAAACEGEREARTKPLQPGTPKVVELTHLRGRQQLVGRVSGAPTPSSASAAAMARMLRRAGSGVSSAARSRNAAAAAAPSRVRARSAERSISAATVSSGHGAAWARCHARRSGSASASVADQGPMRRPPVTGRGRLVDGGADRWVAKAHAAAESDRSCGFRCSRLAHCDLLPQGRAPQQAHVTTGSAAAVSSSCCVSRGSTLNCR